MPSLLRCEAGGLGTAPWAKFLTRSENFMECSLPFLGQYLTRNTHQRIGVGALSIYTYFGEFLTRLSKPRTLSKILYQSDYIIYSKLPMVFQRIPTT